MNPEQEPPRRRGRPRTREKPDEFNPRYNPTPEGTGGGREH